jgi:putative oxidoreductase
VSVLVLVGRTLYVIIFLLSAVNHLTRSEMMAGYTASRGVPAARAAVIGSGVLIGVGGLMLLLGVWGDLGALFIFLFLAPTAVIMHGFWRESEPMARTNERTQFLKDTSMAGAAVVIAALFMYAGHHLGLTLTGPLFHLT